MQQVRPNEKLLAKCPTPSALLERWNPYLQAKASSEVIADLSLNTDIPALVDVKNTYGAQTAYQWLLIQLLSLNNYAGVNNGMSDAQVKELAYLILYNYYYLNLAEIMQFIAKFKLGVYGQFYGYVDPLKIASALQTYIRERKQSIDIVENEQKRKERERQAEENRKNAVKYEQYLQLKQQ